MADKYNLEGFSVDENNVCTSEGGFVGVNYGATNTYTGGGVISLMDRVSILSSGSSYSLATGGGGQEIFIYSVGSGITITPSGFADGTSVTLNSGESIGLISGNDAWFATATNGTINA